MRWGSTKEKHEYKSESKQRQKLPSQADPQPEEPKEDENSIKNWQEEHDSPKYKPTLNLRKVDKNDPNLRNQLEKLKADREERERKTDKECRSTASSVELVDEVIHISGQPVTQEQENYSSGAPLTPLARGWVPPYTGTETPQPSGEEPTSGEEPPKVGEMPPGRDSGQQTVILEPGECAPTSDEHQSDRNYGIDFPSDHEGHDRLQNLLGQQTAAMRKEFPNWWPRDPYDHEQDHTPMPTSPGVAPMTPPSPLYQTQETTLNTRQEAQIIEGIKQLRKDAVPNPTLSPMLSPMGHENANKDPHQSLKISREGS